ncbi:hypothetical protein [Luteolibacter sp. LG18]|uniref:hypothetical protein n=1 Tax=Luteolibacter sp. LG18 TaxID=2819286 RepID=UPI002B27CA90|nr:hypothetical protein llg_26150 [Luteolibacter sp. LG18]
MNSRALLLPLISPALASAAPVDVYWDNSGTSWTNLSAWSLSGTAVTPDPAVVPGGNHQAHFKYSGYTGPTVSLNGDQGIHGLRFDAGNGITTFKGGGTTRSLKLGAGGIEIAAEYGAVDLGSASAGQGVKVFVSEPQTWSVLSGKWIRVENDLSLGPNRLTIAGRGDVLFRGTVSGGGSLVKTGGGQVALETAGSYSGDTRILGGSLRMWVDSLSDTATLELSTGTYAELLYTGTDTVGMLTFDGVPQAPGTWGALDSAADHKTDRIRGTGLVRVPAAVSFAAWQTSHGGAAVAGVQPGRLLEYALDGAAPAGKSRQEIAEIGGTRHLVLTLAVANGVVFTGTGPLVAEGETGYVIEGSESPAGPFQAGVAELFPALADGLPALTPGWSYRTFYLVDAVGTAGGGAFLRCRVTR